MAPRLRFTGLTSKVLGRVEDYCPEVFFNESLDAFHREELPRIASMKCGQLLELNDTKGNLWRVERYDAAGIPVPPLEPDWAKAMHRKEPASELEAAVVKHVSAAGERAYEPPRRSVADEEIATLRGHLRHLEARVERLEAGHSGDRAAHAALGGGK